MSRTDQEPYKGEPIEAAAAVVLFAPLYLGAAAFCALVGPDGGIASVVWLPSGVAVAGLLLTRVALWPLLLVVQMACEVAVAAWLNSQIGVAGTAMMTFARLSEAFLAAALIRWTSGRRPDPASPHFFARLVFFGAVVAAGVGGVAAMGGLEAAFGQAWARWWLADALGILCVAPLILALALPARGAPGRRRSAEGALFAVLFLIAIQLIFGSYYDFRYWPRPAFLATYAVFPFLLWAALRFSPAVAAASIAVLAVMAAFYTLELLGPFEMLWGYSPSGLLELQFFLVISALCTLIVSGAVHEIRRDAARRGARQDDLRYARRLEIQRQLAGAVAHDFNNYLTAILGYADLAAPAAGDNREISESIQQIELAAERSTAVTRKLLAFSRRQDLRLKPVDVNMFLERNAGKIERLLGSATQVELEVEAELPYAVADEEHLERAVLELLANAGDAMPDGGGVAIRTSSGPLPERLAARLPGGDSGQEFVVLEIEDEGEGMDAATLESAIFPYFSTREKTGTKGLGLSIAEGTISQMGGVLDLASALGRGTLAAVYLPVSAELPSEDLPAPSSRRRMPGSGSETVLLVEDRAQVRRLAVSTLAQAGYHVLQAESGPAALQLLKESNAVPQLLVTDIMMPEMSGIDLAREVAMMYPDIRHLYMTSYVHSFEIPVQGIDGDVYLLAKPFKPGDLLLAARRALDGDDPRG